MRARDRSRRARGPRGWRARLVRAALALIVAVAGTALLAAPATTRADHAAVAGTLSFMEDDYVSVSELNFGDQPVGIPMYRTVQLRTYGQVTNIRSTLSSIVDGSPVADLDFFDFDQGYEPRNQCLKRTSLLSEYCTIFVVFRPSTLGVREGEIVVEYDDGDSRQELKLLLTGTGVGPISMPHTYVKHIPQGGNGTVRITPIQAGIPSWESPYYAPGTDLTLTAEPGEGYFLERWDIQGVDYGTQNPVRLRTNGEAVISVTTAFNIGNPVPAITGLNPSHVQAGSAPLTITVGGTKFIPGSVVHWNGSPRPTTFVGGTELRAELTAADLGSEAVADITVVNPAPVGGTSYPVAFFVTRGSAAVTASASGTSTDPHGGATASMGG